MVRTEEQQKKLRKGDKSTQNSAQRLNDPNNLKGVVTHMHACIVRQSYMILCDTMDCSLPGSSVHGILQARILEWVVIPFSRGPS